MVPFPLVNPTVMAFSYDGRRDGTRPPFLQQSGQELGRGEGGGGGRQADRKSIRRGFSAWPTHCCSQAGRQASQGRLNTVIISELCLPWPGWPSYTYLLAGWGSQPVIENQPTPRANVSLSLLNSLFRALGLSFIQYVGL